MAEHRCPTCGTQWSPLEAQRAAQRALQRLRDEMADQTTPPAVGTPRAAVEPAVPGGAAGGVPIDADRGTPGAFLRRRREQLNLTQEIVADDIGTVQSAISDLEAGADARLSTLRRWAGALGYDVVLVPATGTNVDQSVRADATTATRDGGR